MKAASRRAASAVLVFLALSLCATGDGSAGQTPTYGPWRYCMIGGGGFIQNVVLCPSDPDRYYAYVDVAGAFRSDDRGAQWVSLYPGLPCNGGVLEVRSLLVDPDNAARVLIATGSQWSRQPGGVYLSEDAGNTWRQVAADVSFPGNAPYRGAGVVLARSPAEPHLLLAASAGGGVLRSTDDGLTWANVGLKDVYFTDIRFDPAQPRRAWLCAQPVRTSVNGTGVTLAGGFYRSEDAGATWQKLSEVSPTEVLREPAGPGRLLGIIERRPCVSADDGASWRPFGEGLPPAAKDGNPAEGNFDSLAAGPDFVLTASTKGTFYRLPDGGSGWQKVERQGVQEVYERQEWFRHSTGGMGDALSSIVVDPRDPAHWFFTDWYAIYQTHDAGRNWALTINGIESTVLHCLTQDPSDPGVVHLGMADNGYFYSLDGGARFHNVGWQKGINNNIKCISLSPKAPDRLYATGCRTWEWEANQVFVSVDRGQRWVHSPMTGLPDMTKHDCDSIDVDPRDPYSAWLTVSGDVAPGGGGVYRSTDGGKSWTWQGQGLPQGGGAFSGSIWVVGREIALGADGGLVCISRDRSMVFRRGPDDGVWREAKLNLGGQPNCVVADHSQPGHFYLAADGVYESADAGASWQKVYDQPAQYVAVDGARPQRVAAGAKDGVVLSLDGGRTWRMTDQRLPHRPYCEVAFAGERLLAGTAGNGAFWMPLSEQGAGPVEARPVPGGKETNGVFLNN
jgi:photosystem II stability/assembly factor-like uncharacterized protein